LKELLKKLQSNDESERLYAVEDILEKGLSQATPYLIDRLKEEDSQVVKDMIVFALKKLNCSEEYDRLFNLFSSPDAYLRNAAIVIFASEGNRAVAYLASKLDYSDKEVRKLILDSLVEIGTEDAKLAIRASLNDPAPNVRITAVEYLGRMKDKNSIDDLMDLFKREDEPMLKTTIMEAILAIGDKDKMKEIIDEMCRVEEGEIDPLFIPQLIKMAGEIADRSKFLNIIEKMGDLTLYAEDILKALQNTFKQIPEREVISYKEKLLNTLLKILESDDIGEDLRYEASEIIIKNNLLSPQELFDLGNRLLSKDSRYHMPGIRLMAASNIPSVKDRLRQICSESKDENIIEICDDILTGKGV